MNIITKKNNKLFYSFCFSIFFHFFLVFFLFFIPYLERIKNFNKEINLDKNEVFLANLDNFTKNNQYVKNYVEEKRSQKSEKNFKKIQKEKFFVAKKKNKKDKKQKNSSLEESSYKGNNKAKKIDNKEYYKNNYIKKNFEENSNLEILEYRKRLNESIRKKFYNYTNYIGQFCELKISIAPNGTLISVYAKGDDALCKAAVSAVRSAEIPCPPNNKIYEIFKCITFEFVPN